MTSLLNFFDQQQLESIKSNSHTPLYHQLYSLLKQAITNGTVGHGTQMPTEQQLSAEFDVSRITAKRAMDELASEGLVTRSRGKGTHVTFHYEPSPIQAPLTGMLQELESMARHTQVKLLSLAARVPPAHIRKALELADGETAVHMVRVRYKDDQPFGYYTSWTVLLSEDISREDVIKKPRLELFRDHGLKISHMKQTISATAATTEHSAALDIPIGSPLLSLTRKSYRKTKQGEQLVDWLAVVYHPERFQYEMDLNV